MRQPTEAKHGFPIWMVAWWWSALLLAAPFYLRILYEQTILTWREGRQAVGFSLAHLYPEILIAGMFGCALSIVWIAVAAVYLAWKKKKPANSAIIYLALPAAAVLAALIPYDLWASLGGVK